jgi:hypothetical protein
VIERPEWYVTKFLNPAAIDGFSSLSLTLQTDSDAPFRLFGIAFYVFDAMGVPQAAAGNINVLVEFTKPDGTTFYQRHQIPAQAIQPFDQGSPLGAASLPAPFYSYFSRVSPNQLYPPRTTVAFDFSDVAGTASTQVMAVLVGTKIFKDGEVWAPQYPAKYTALPFDYNVQIGVGLTPTLNTPLTISPDADFVYQRGAQTDQNDILIIPPGAETFQGTVIFTATLAGAAAGATIEVTFPGGGPAPLSITVVGGVITVNLAVDAFDSPITTGAQLIAAWNASPAALLASIAFTPTLGPFSPFNLAPQGFTASLAVQRGLGIIFRDTYGKSYMNDYVPIELIFGFDNSQRPGLVYPEIYIPRVQQLFMDISAGTQSGILTLTFKGMKVYGG